MSEVLRPQLLTDGFADAAVASLGRKFVQFLIFPFRLVHAMRPQREREAARIAEEFHCRRHGRPV